MSKIRKCHSTISPPAVNNVNVLIYITFHLRTLVSTSIYLPIYKFRKIISYNLCLIAFYFVVVLDSQKRYEDSAEFPCSPHPTSPIANILHCSA